jgi:hypothetical protein
VPRSLIGQLALVMAAALLIAQAINFTLIYNERQRVSRAQAEGPAIGRFVMHAQRVAAIPAGRSDEPLETRGRRGRYWIAAEAAVGAGAEDGHLVERLREAAAANGLTLRDARAASEDAVDVPPRLRERMGPARAARMDERLRRFRTLVLSAQLSDGRWVNGRIVTQRPNPWLILRPLAATLLTYLIILAAAVWVAARLTRPLRDLTAAAERFQGRGEVPHVTPAGPTTSPTRSAPSTRWAVG